MKRRKKQRVNGKLNTDRRDARVIERTSKKKKKEEEEEEKEKLKEKETTEKM